MQAQRLNDQLLNMELTSSLFLALIGFLCLFHLLEIRKRPTANLPPGPWKLPIIGSIHHLIGSPPHLRLTELAKTYGPIMHLKLGEVSIVVISSPDAAKEIIKIHEVNFSNRSELISMNIVFYKKKDVVFAPYGDYWQQMRKICVQELLSAKRVKSFKWIRESEVNNLVRSIYANILEPVKLGSRLVCLSNDITARATIGAKCTDQEKLVTAIAEALEAAGGFGLADIFPSWPLLGLATGVKLRAEKCHREVDHILDGIIQEGKKNRKIAEANLGESEIIEEDILDVLLRIQEEGGLDFPLTNDSIKAIIFDMFAGGTETSSAVTEWVMSELIRNPDMMRRVQAEVREVFQGKHTTVTEEDTSKLSYLKLVIKETLRLHPPGPFLLPRDCAKTCRILGYDITEKTRVLVNIWAMGRDSRYWEDPEKFKPERFQENQIDFKGNNFEFIPFGAGKRICPGMIFGLASVELALANLIYFFDWSLPNGANAIDLNMTEKLGAAARRKIELRLCAMPRMPCPFD